MPQITAIKGFANTPVSRSVIAVSTVSSLALSVFFFKQYVVLSIDPFVIQYGQYWRVATFQWAMVNESDFLLSTVLWFHFKVLERFFGSRKYLSLLAVLALYNAIATFLVLCLGQLSLVGVYAVARTLLHRQPLKLEYFDTIFNSVTPGPLGILASLYMCHGWYIPVSYRFKILLKRPKDDESPGTAITLSNHFQIHVLFTILMLNHGLSSIIPCLVGILVGTLYTQDLLAGSKSWVLPKPVYHLFVSPRKLRLSSFRLASLRGYRPVHNEPSPERGSEEPPERQEDDEARAIDDIRHGIDDSEDRSATPVRPLGRQFLDTFRT